jgi:tight adherence protein C
MNAISIIAGIGLLLIGPLLLLLSLRWLLKDEVNVRLQEYVADTEGQSRFKKRGTGFIARELTGPLMSRLFLPWLRWIGRIFERWTPAGGMNELDRRLMVAGNPFGFEAREFFAVQLAFLLLGGFLGMVFILRGVNRESIIFGVAAVFLGYLLPRFWLSSKMKERKNKIQKGLPDALDMLSVCIAAGLGFDQALKRVSEYWPTQVGYEFGRVITEMEMGFSRRVALRNLVMRVDVPEISSFVSFVLQTEQLGLSIADTLHGHAAQMRIERRFRAQEQAQKIPVKMLVPMAFLIFPAIMAVVIGPVVPTLAEFLTSLGG